MIKTILVDLGNVIVYVDHDVIIDGLVKHSNKNKKFIHDYFYNSLTRRGFDKGKLSSIDFFNKYKNNLNLKLNFNQFNKIWCSCFTGLNKDMEKLLNKLKKDYKLILLSNTDEIHFLYLKKKYKILNIFDDFILSYKVGYKKPNPMIYLHAIKKAKTIPSQILYIDDIYQYVLAAKFFGIKSIQYKTIERLNRDLKIINIKI